MLRRERRCRVARSNVNDQHVDVAGTKPRCPGEVLRDGAVEEVDIELGGAKGLEIRGQWRDAASELRDRPRPRRHYPARLPT
jgi:hypothetical protein